MVKVGALFISMVWLFHGAEAFVVSSQRSQSCLLPASSLSAAKTTLDEHTTWKLSFLLQGLPTEQGKKVDEIFTIEAQFNEEVGFEPPQGDVKQVGGSISSKDGEEASSPRLKVVKSRWQLSEDPEDRKDGLWIWGLFQEPLYPFLLLQLETDRVPVPGADGDFISPLKLFAQINHKREKETGVILSASELKVRKIETRKADVFGAATVDVYEEFTVGKLNIQAMK
jgi:hypothetical protein